MRIVKARAIRATLLFMTSCTLRIATWNINSVRLRLPSLARVVAQLRPDILCLQETKVQDALFPFEPIAAMGFPHQRVRGEKSYNGVAILSKYPIASVSHIAFCNKQDTRHLSACITLPNTTLKVHNLYVPAGGYVADAVKNPKFAHKLNFVEEISQHFPDAKGEQPCVLLGDLNIAPLPSDVWNHEKMLQVVSHTPEEVERFTRAQNARGWCDVLRKKNPPPEKIYTWWSYRRPWEENYGRRLDHIWANETLAKGLDSTEILTEARGWQQPSDHVPVLAEFLLP